MKLTDLSQLTEDEARAVVQAMVKDAERQWLTASFNRSMNTGASAQQFDDVLNRIRDGLARTKLAFAAYLTPTPATSDKE